MVADDIRIDGNKVSFSLVFEKPTDPFAKSLVKAAEAALKTFVGEFVEPTVSMTFLKQTPAAVKNVLPGVKNIIGVSSGKGGVGKSTVSSNLAVALAREGYKVGLLDADIFGPSVPKMFGVEDEQVYMHEVDGRPLIIPVERYGVKMLSIGFLLTATARCCGAAEWQATLSSSLSRRQTGASSTIFLLTCLPAQVTSTLLWCRLSL